MKIGICIIGDMLNRHRNWERTKEGLKEKLIDCWDENHTVSVYIVSNNIPENIVEFFKPRIYTTNCHYLSMISKYGTCLSMITEEDLDFIICTRPDAVFFESVNTFNILYDKFNFLFRETLHWNQKYTCDNFYAFPKRYIHDFISVLNYCPKNTLHSNQMHSLVYPCLVDLIEKKNIHFIQKETDFSGSGLNKFYLLDRYDCVEGDLGPCSIDAWKKWIVENENFVNDNMEKKRRDTSYLEDEHEHS